MLNIFYYQILKLFKLTVYFYRMSLDIKKLSSLCYNIYNWSYTHTLINYVHTDNMLKNKILFYEIENK